MLWIRFLNISKAITKVCAIKQDLSGQSASSIASEVCGLITVLSGTTVLHSTREPDPPPSTGTCNEFMYILLLHVGKHHSFFYPI